MTGPQARERADIAAFSGSICTDQAATGKEGKEARHFSSQIEIGIPSTRQKNATNCSRLPIGSSPNNRMRVP